MMTDDIELEDGEELTAEEAKAKQDRAEYEAIQRVGSALQKKFEDYYRRRLPIEAKWLEDTRQYYGQYDPDVLNALVDAGGSTVFLNITRPKTNAFVARMQDMLLPTEDKNWGIEPTPIPEGDFKSEADQPITDGMGRAAATPEGAQVTVGDAVEGAKIAAREASEKMERQIDDRLQEAGYNSIQRRSIQQCGLLGTGVIEGPVQIKKVTKKWAQVTDAGWQKVDGDSETVPSVEFVDAWDFFPDMNSSDPSEWEDGFRRYYMNDKLLREAARRSGFNSIAIAELLGGESRAFLNTDSHLSQLRQIQGVNDLLDGRRTVLKYVGPIERDDLAAMGVAVDDDPLTDYYATVWLCEGLVLKVAPYHLDSNKLPWSVCYCEKDATSPFGWGIPRMMRGEQKSANAAWRMIIDNGGLSVGPQTIIDSNAVMPANGKMRLEPKKIWLKRADMADVPIDNVFKQFTVDSHQQEMINIFNVAQRMADEVTMLPIIMQGDQASHITDTAKGMSILNNNANIVLKRAAKLYDDYCTNPLITRMFEWEMQFNKDDSIKGDHIVMPKGATVLLEKEMQAQAMMQLMQFKGTAWDAYFDWYVVASESAKTMRIARAVPTRDKVEAREAELRKMQAEAAAAAANAQGPKLTPEEREERERDRAHDKEMAILKYANEKNITLDKARIELATQARDLDHKAGMFNAEASLRERTGAGI